MDDLDHKIAQRGDLDNVLVQQAAYIPVEKVLVVDLVAYKGDPLVDLAVYMG